MGQSRSIGINTGQFHSLASAYCRRWGAGLCAIRPDGSVVHARGCRGWSGADHREARRLAVAEALRWGEPAVEPAPGDRVVWGVPLMHNAQVLGGLVAGISESRLFGRGPARRPRIDVRAACAQLRELAEAHNLVNAALLETRRREYMHEQIRAQAIHDFKSGPAQDMHALYLLEEPALAAAIRKKDRRQARGILNRLLVAMIHRAAGRADLVKSFFLELVVAMSRTAVEAGGRPEELLGANYDSITRLAVLRDDEELARWLHEALERILGAMGAGTPGNRQPLPDGILRAMAQRCDRRLGRDDAADAAGLSPSHFSRLFRAQYGRTFTQVRLQLRVDRAAELLARSELPLKIVALRCGFTDQSHLTRLFRRRYGATPARYRREHQNTKE